jgi:tRNA uridine 5-carbamoylmethylation protein Kti12
MPVCNILIGVPCSGKTEWTTRFSKLDADHKMPSMTASSDYFIEEAAKLFGVTYNIIFDNVSKYATIAFWKYVETLSYNSLDFNIDRTNLTYKTRKELMSFVRKTNPMYTFDAYVFETPPDDVITNRTVSRHGKGVPKDVLDSMIEAFCEPSLDEGFKNIHKIRTF